MKKCPFCAEDIQDAAIVCKHCGRELKGANVGAVTVRAKSRPWVQILLILVGVGVLAIVGLVFVGGVARGLNRGLENQHVSGECRLPGAAMVTPYDAPVGGGVLAITNRDTASWNDAQISIYGQVTSGPDKGPAGVHKLRRTIESGLNAINLRDFENAEGARWVPVMMRVEGVGVAATVRGEHCELELSFERR